MRQVKSVHQTRTKRRSDMRMTFHLDRGKQTTNVDESSKASSACSSWNQQQHNNFLSSTENFVVDVDVPGEEKKRKTGNFLNVNLGQTDFRYIRERSFFLVATFLSAHFSYFLPPEKASIISAWKKLPAVRILSAFYSYPDIKKSLGRRSKGLSCTYLVKKGPKGASKSGLEKAL